MKLFVYDQRSHFALFVRPYMSPLNLVFPKTMFLKEEISEMFWAFSNVWVDLQNVKKIQCVGKCYDLGFKKRPHICIAILAMFEPERLSGNVGQIFDIVEANLKEI